ncbi:MAG TPA: glutathione S-transferase family protein, partial [Pseudomonas sp.]|nr:glutathione S-transferase family protein [Pseudomonas sp.]
GYFDYLEQSLGEAEFFVGNTLTQADLAIYSQLQNMEHGGETLDEQRWPALAAHYRRIQARDSVQSLLPGERKIIAKISGKP